MFHQQIKLPEKHPDYPSLWQSICGKWRVIRCRDDIQFIVQQYKSPKWRSESYHVEWESISLIHGDKEAFNTLPDSI
jgi:hypothetical protein